MAIGAMAIAANKKNKHNKSDSFENLSISPAAVPNLKTKPQILRTCLNKYIPATE